MLARLAVLLALLLWVGIAQSVSAAEAALARSTLTPRTLLFAEISLRDEMGDAPINAVTQDRRGYIWYGTQEGLFRYDGQEVRVYEHSHEDSRSLSNDWVWTLFVDNQGTLWAGTEGGGLNRYDSKTDSFRHYRHRTDQFNSLSSDRVRVVFQDRQGIHWIGTDGGGLNRFDSSTGSFSRYRHDPELPESLAHDSVLAISEDRAGNLWVGTNGGGLSRLDRKTGMFSHFQNHPQRPNSLSNDKVRAILEDREGRLWIGTYEGGLNLFDSASGTFRRFSHDPDAPLSLSNNRIRGLLQDRDGTLWVATDGGLNEWRPAEQGFVSYHHDSTDNSSISDDRISALYQDRGGVLWVGTYNGLNNWNYLSDAFNYLQAKGSAPLLSSDIVTAVAESGNGELWVGTYGGGLNRINPADSSVSYYRANAESRDSGGNSLRDDRVMALHVDPQQKIWIGTRGAGLSRLDPVTGEFIHYVHDPSDSNSLTTDKVASILGEADGTVWVGTYGGGLNRIDSNSGQVTAYRHDPADSSSLGSDRVLAIYRDRAGTLWIGSEDGGLNRFDAVSQSFVRYRNVEGDPDSLSADSAWAIHESRDGSLWIGTNGGGLNRWSPADRSAGRVQFEHYRKEQGLPSDMVQGILEDGAGYIWASTNRGLVQLDPASGRVLHFGRNSGLKGSEFNFGARLQSQSGKLMFGGTTGLVAFDPARIKTNRHPPDVVLGAFNQQGPLTTGYSVDAADQELELDYQNYLVTFKFAGLDYAAPDKNSYRYMLEGFDPDWTETREFTRATYTNLPAGDYRFTVQAANNDGVWNEQGASMQLRVTPPPWRSTWAYVAYVTLLISVISVYLRSQSKKLEWETQQRQELELQVAARTGELANRNDELLSLNEQLKTSSWTDSLTGLKNRRFLDEFIAAEVALALRQAKNTDLQAGMLETLDIAPALSFLMIDLDGFKAINDLHGHHAGDEALLQVRDILQQCCRKSDTIIRWGGDEFLIIGRNTSNRAAEKLAERIRVGLAEHQYQVGAGAVSRLSGSIGFAVYPFSPLNPEIASWEQVSALADRCAYIAKENGRNAWVGLSGNRDTSAQDVVSALNNDLEQLLAQGIFGLRTSITKPLKFGNKRQQENR